MAFSGIEFVKRKKRTDFFYWILFLGLVPSLFWGMNVYQVVGEADRSCKSIDAMVNSKSVSMDDLVESASEGQETWKIFDSPQEAKKAINGRFTRNAKVFFNNNLPVRVDLEMKSPTKEWVHYIRYYFRKDGSLEKTHSDFRRFGAYEKEKGMEQQFLVKVIRDRYFDSKGKMVRKVKPRFFNMSTMSELKNVIFKEGPWPIYLRFQQLPFNGLLKTSDPSEPEAPQPASPAPP